jgi:hypothetical protein
MRVLKILLLVVLFFKHVSMSQLMKGVQKPSIYFDHVCHVKATKLYNLALKVKEE